MSDFDELGRRTQVPSCAPLWPDDKEIPDLECEQCNKLMPKGTIYAWVMGGLAPVCSKECAQAIGRAVGEAK